MTGLLVLLNTTNLMPIDLPNVQHIAWESDCLFSEVFGILLKLVLLCCVMYLLELEWALLYMPVCMCMCGSCLHNLQAGCQLADGQSSKLPARWDSDCGLHPWPTINLNIERNNPWW